ncbi:hypothetical protein K8T06_07335 [bacterium]|nr:hypothetical protein [bacterium]
MARTRKIGYALLLVALFLTLAGYLSGCDDDNVTGDDPNPADTPRPGLNTPVPPEIPDGPCARGSALVQITNIPEMTDANKEDINKLQLFCLRDNNNVTFVGVFHRYVQFTWPEGPWFPAWRLEAGSDGCIEEWHIYDANPLEDSSAKFKIEWDHNYVAVTHVETGNKQYINMQSTAGFELVGRPGDCTHFGNPNSCHVETLQYICTTAGGPSGC